MEGETVNKKILYPLAVNLKPLERTAQPLTKLLYPLERVAEPLGKISIR